MPLLPQFSPAVGRRRAPHIATGEALGYSLGAMICHLRRNP